MKKLLSTILIFCMLANAQETDRAILNELIVTREFTMEGRKAFRYEHSSSKSWGYNNPQSDYFYLIEPRKAARNAPLRVILHSAGHSGDKIIKEAFTKRRCLQYYGDDEHYLLYLDCRKNKHDWWWGYHSIKKQSKVFQNKMSPTENRLMDTVEWVIRKNRINRNLVYLSGVSMGGSSSRYWAYHA